MLHTSACRFPEKEALVHGNWRLTYNEVVKEVLGLAHGLRLCGLQRGDRIGIYLDASIPQVLSILAASQAGGVFVPINSTLFPNQVTHIARDCRMKALITTKSKLVSLAGAIDHMPSLEFAVVVSDAESEARTEDRGTKLESGMHDAGDVSEISLAVHCFEELCQSTRRCELNDIAIEKDLAAILYTSGSTGRPKGVMLSHANVMAGSSIVSTYLEITDADRILAVLPFSFDAGLNQLMTAFQQGGTLVLMTFTFAREIVQMLLKERITGLAGVPTLWSLLAQPSSALRKQIFPELRYITNTGGRMPQSVLTVLRQALPTTKVFLMYGLTEAFRSTYLPPEELDRRPTSMGKAIPNTEILVINSEGNLCEPGEVGELVHRGPTVSMGYWGQPELTARVLRPHPLLSPELGNDEKVCYSGDLVKSDKDGFLYFVGRRDNMIKSSGFRISPSEVEETLFQTGRIREAAVIGIPDDILGQAIKAFVVPQDGKVLDPDDLIAFCAERMPRYMVPKTVEVFDALPKTPSRKIDYSALREREGLS
jgi:acyl-CoA ligase (AMP-forming) (exosortase A-associated)